MKLVLNPHKNSLKVVCSSLLKILLTILFCFQAQAVTKGLEEGWESYLDRPDILTMNAKELSVEDLKWESLKRAHFSFVAFLLEAYQKNVKIYFLGRDSEYLYDVARLVTMGTEEAKRIHLLNISRGNMRDAQLGLYLKQNGISTENLRNGQRVLFVDTGFSGTIPAVIGESFPEDVRQYIKTHLVVSATPEHPSSYSFLLQLNSMVLGLRPDSMHGSIINYEHMPRFTDRSDRFIKIGQVLHPVSRLGSATDGSVDKAVSVSYMQDLVSSWSLQETRKRFNFERSQVSWLRQALQNGAQVDRITGLLQAEGKSVVEAQIRDLFLASKNLGVSYALSLETLGLKDSLIPESVSSKKAEMILKFPEWKHILENPEDEIPKLFKKGDWQTVGSLIDADVDMEINHLISKSLFDAPAQGIKKDLQVLYIKKGEHDRLSSVVMDSFSQPYAKDMKDLIKLVIEYGDDDVLGLLAETVFSEPHARIMLDLIELVIDKGGDGTLEELVKGVLVQPPVAKKEFLIKKMIARSGAEVDIALVEWIFAQPGGHLMTDSLRMVIEKKDPRVLEKIASLVFSRPATKKMTDLLKLSIQNSSPDGMGSFFSHVFSKPHTAGLHEHLRMALEKASGFALKTFVLRVLTEPHAKDKKYLLRYVLEKGNSDFLQSFLQLVLSNPKIIEGNKDLTKIFIEKADATQLMRKRATILGLIAPNDLNYKVISSALQIDDAKERKAYLDRNYINEDILKPQADLKYQKMIRGERVQQSKLPGRCQKVFL